MSQKGGLFCSRPPRGLGGASVVGGRSHGEELRKASPCFPTAGGLRSVRRSYVR